MIAQECVVATPALCETIGFRSNGIDGGLRADPRSAMDRRHHGVATGRGLKRWRSLLARLSRLYIPASGLRRLPALERRSAVQVLLTARSRRQEHHHECDPVFP